VAAATYTAGYTHGTTGENDQIYFNNVALGDAVNDVALGTALDYGPSLNFFDVTSLLGSTSTIRYSVDPLDVGASGESYLRPNVGLLEIVHPVPEPGTWAMMASGFGVSLFVGRKRLARWFRKKAPVQTAAASGEAVVQSISAARAQPSCAHRARSKSGRARRSTKR
jgi:hypothetical protein